MSDDHAKAIELIRKLKRINPTGKLVLALADELTALRSDLARISEEYGLPPTIGPAPGEIKRREQLLRDYRKQVDTLRTALAALRQRHAEAVIEAIRFTIEHANIDISVNGGTGCLSPELAVERWNNKT